MDSPAAVGIRCKTFHRVIISPGPSSEEMLNIRYDRSLQKERSVARLVPESCASLSKKMSLKQY